MKFSVTLKESGETLSFSRATSAGVFSTIQDSLVYLAVEHVKKHRPKASFSLAETNFIKEFESDLFFEFAHLKMESLSLYRYMMDTSGKTYTLNYKIERL